MHSRKLPKTADQRVLLDFSRLVFGVVLLTWPSGQLAQNTSTATAWRGLVLGQSSPGEAISLFGKPRQDDKHAFDSFEPVWGTSGLYEHVSHDRKDLREITLKRVEGFRSVRLLFLADRLMSISLEPEEFIGVQDLPKVYGVPFQFWNLSRFDQLVDPLDPKDPPTRFDLTGEFGKYGIMRKFYILGIQDGNVITGYAFSFGPASEGVVSKLRLVSKDYLEPKKPTKRPSASELLK